MYDVRISRALISVYDKGGLVELGRGLAELGVEIISTGGTAKVLADAGLAVRPVEQVTGFGQMLDGQVKTLHPAIHAAILADRDRPEHLRQLGEHGIEPIDLVVCNLYPFERVVAEPGCRLERAIENIDIGGPCLLRAAAKNYRHVLVVCRPGQYPELIERLRQGRCVIGSEDPMRLRLAREAFRLAGSYNRAISGYLSDELVGRPEAGKDALGSELEVFLGRKKHLRYGENPHQRAALYAAVGQEDQAVAGARQIAGEELSYNNYLDADAAMGLLRELAALCGPAERPAAAAVLVKHGNACGAAIADDVVEAYRKAYLGDPVAAMGGVLAVNQPVGEALAEAVMDSYRRWGKAAGAAQFFLDVWIGPGFDETAVRIITTARRGRTWGQRVRLLSVASMAGWREEPGLALRQITGGMLVQRPDPPGLNEADWRVVTRRKPSAAEMADLRLAWLICKHGRSNAIAICRDGMLLGVGAGQASRVMACKLAVELAGSHLGGGRGKERAVAASDGFFPVADGPQTLIEAGVTALIQPGGSKADDEVIACCDRRDVAMVVTGRRHFRH